MQPDVSIKVVADTAQAEAALRKTGAQLRSAATSTASASAGPAAAGGETVGKQIASAAVGFIANQGLQAITSAVASQDGSGRLARRISGIGGGLLGGAAAGAAAGSVIPGVGTAIGAVVGAAIGGLTAFTKELAQTTTELREARFSERMMLQGIEVGQATGAQDRAFTRMLSTKGRDEQQALIASRIAQLTRGSGSISIKNLRADLRAREEAGEMDSQAYRVSKAELSMQAGRVASLLRLKEELGNAPQAPLLGAGAVTDSLAKMGGSVGAQVNVADVNRQQLEVQREMLRALNRLANADPSEFTAVAVFD